MGYTSHLSSFCLWLSYLCTTTITYNNWIYRSKFGSPDQLQRLHTVNHAFRRIAIEEWCKEVYLFHKNERREMALTRLENPSIARRVSTLIDTKVIVLLADVSIRQIPERWLSPIRFIRRLKKGYSIFINHDIWWQIRPLTQSILNIMGGMSNVKKFRLHLPGSIYTIPVCASSNGSPQL